MNPSFIAKCHDAAMGLLGSLRANLLETGAACETAGVTSGHLPSPLDHLFSALMKMWKSGEGYDFIALHQRLRADGTLGRFSDQEAIQEVLHTPSIGCEVHIRHLLECQAARHLHEVGARIVATAFDPSMHTQGLLEASRADLEKIRATPSIRRTRLSHFAAQVLDELERSVHADTGEAIPFGLGLDDLAGPFCRGDLIVLAASTKRGKSAIAGNIVENVASGGRSCAVFSLEMTGRQNAERMLASQGLINIRELRKRINVLQREMMDRSVGLELARLRNVLAKMENWKVEMFEDTHRIDQIVAEMIRMKSQGLDLSVVDYAQFVRGVRSHGDSREREVASISHELKLAAMKTDSIVLLLSQINEEGKLRESRALAQDANCVLSLEGEDGSRTVRVVAARSAPTGAEIPIQWRAEYTRFEEGK